LKQPKPKITEIPAKLRVLEIGAGPKPQAKKLLPNTFIETMDVDPQYNPTYLHDAATIPAELYGKFDLLFASHVLEHFPWFETHNILTEWRKALKIGGFLHVLVPSLEWAAEQIMSGHPSKAINGHLYAGSQTQWDVHKAGFTLPILRAHFEHARFAVAMAESGPYPIAIGSEIMRAEQHYIVGQKASGDDYIL